MISEESELVRATREYYLNMDDKEEPPSAKAIDEGYNQTYLIMAAVTRDADSKCDDNHEVFFRCGNWCYKGQIQFGGVEVNTEELPILIPLLQKQQGSLRYYCNAKSVPTNSDYSEPLKFLEDACEFIGQEILSESVDRELRKMAAVFPWIDDDNSSTYFELTLSNVPACLKKVKMIASKTYTRGLIIISIYSEGAIYFIMQPGEGDQALLDVRFPDVSQHGQGLHIDSYNDHTTSYRKLTLWHVLGNSSTKRLPKEIPKIKTINVSTKNYQQTYIILKSCWDNNSPTLTVHHDVLFRFGSWCYCGRVQLTPSLTLADIPYVIPALRMQQSRLDYLCDVNQVPTTSPFAPALGYVQNITPLLEDHIRESEDTLRDLVDRLTGMGLGDSVSRWLEGDPANSFFEFKIAPDDALSETFKNVELVVSKCYYASGIIAITIIYQHTVYVSLLDNNGESPLLDSRFPDVSGKGRGYQLQSYNAGDREDWPALRKVSIWQTVNALEQEFREKADAVAQSKPSNGAITMTTSVKENSAGGGEGGSSSKQHYTEREDDDGEDMLVVNSMRSSNLSAERGNSAGSKGDAPADSKTSPAVVAAMAQLGNSPSPTDPETEVMRADEKFGPAGSTSRSAQAAALASRTGGNTNQSYEHINSASGAVAGAASQSSVAVGAGAKAGSSIDNGRSLDTVGASMGSMSLGGVSGPAPGKASMGVGLKPLGGGGGRPLQALPHHIPKMDSLSNRMDDIRRNMGEEGLKAPWDSKGKPLGSISSPLGKESKK